MVALCQSYYITVHVVVCVAVCCSVLQCVAALLQCVADFRRRTVLRCTQSTHTGTNVWLHCVNCIVLQCVQQFVLQCVAVCCSVVAVCRRPKAPHCVLICKSIHAGTRAWLHSVICIVLQCVLRCVLQRAEVCFSVLQHCCSALPVGRQIVCFDLQIITHSRTRTVELVGMCM